MIIPLPAFQDNYIWLIVHENRRTLTCIDPGDAIPVLSYATHHQLSLESILLTHHHHDHIGGVAPLCQHFPDAIVYAPHDQRIPFAHRRVSEGDTLKMTDYCFRVMEIPGHTSSHIAYHDIEQHWLFCGDTLFSGGCGRVFDGSLEDLYNSLLKIRQLPPQTAVYCAHEYTQANLRFAAFVEPQNPWIQAYQAELAQHHPACTLPSTLAKEKNINPFLRADTVALRDFALTRQLDWDDPFEIFKCLRAEKNEWT